MAVLRFSFSKELKFIVCSVIRGCLPATHSTCIQNGKVCKPYNSVLGEHFRAHWDVDDATQTQLPYTLAVPTGPSNSLDANSAASETASVKSGQSSKSTRSGLSSTSKPRKSPSTAPTSPQPAQPDATDQMSNLNLNGNSSEPSRLRVVFLTEQVSHHPPVSSYYAACPARSLELYGIDQISAKVSGTTLKVYPGEFNQGIFIKITGGHGQGETYKITHPVASVNGILRGSFYVTISDSIIISCTGGKHGQKFRGITEYKEEVWIFLLTAPRRF